jgi:hypothetical protein
MVFVQDVRRAQAFIAVVFKRDTMPRDVLDNVIKQCRLADLCGKPKYLLIEKGEDQGVFSDMVWRKVVRFTDKNDVPKIMQFIDDEITKGVISA